MSALTIADEHPFKRDEDGGPHRAFVLAADERLHVVFTARNPQHLHVLHELLRFQVTVGALKTVRGSVYSE